MSTLIVFHKGGGFLSFLKDHKTYLKCYDCESQAALDSGDQHVLGSWIIHQEANHSVI